MYVIIMRQMFQLFRNKAGKLGGAKGKESMHEKRLDFRLLCLMLMIY